MFDGSPWQSNEALLLSLTQAVAEGQLAVRYQPKFDLFRRRVSGVEALVRWPRPTGPEIPPTTFIPLAEAAGLIEPLGAWVLEQACRQVATWNSLGLDLSVAVNVSPLQLAPSAGLEALVAQTLAESGLLRTKLELEITEGVLMDADARTTVNRLIESGISIALDDFGTGYSSLAYLRHLRAKTLKIDKSFLDGLPGSLDDCILVGSIIRLAHSFGMEVVAEGVETQEQQDVLELMGCDLIQGYALSRPLSANDIPRFIASLRQAPQSVTAVPV
jgi:EAL domain-containing protein (putative c-di-GMP-specific phosphodiesterase class I)